MKERLINRSRQRSDDWGRTVAARIACVADLVAEEARYHNSCMIKFYQVPRSEKKRGYRPAENVDEAMECIYAFLEENSSECQFTLQQLINSIEGDYRPDVRTIQSRLLNKYGDDMIAVRGSRPTIVCFRNTGYKVLSEAWYSKKKDNPQEERLRVVREAAAIVLQDIRSQMYEVNEYPPTDDFLRDVDTVIPETLCALMEALILKHKRGFFDKWHLKCTAIAHAIISAARPNSFLSALQIGVGVFLYKKFGSRQLLDVLSNLGYSASYAESLLFETSAIKRGPINIATEAFSQFVFDNADFNTNTLDGLNTFHAMGGIQCVTPRCAVAPDQAIPRLTKIPTATIVGQFGNVPIQIFRKSLESGLMSIPIEDLQTSHPIENTILPTSLDLLWLYGKSQNLSHLPGWNGFMEEATAEKPFKRSQIICLPFITAPPSDYDTILTAILSALEQCKSLKQETCFVTFDQPLYIKARDIIANNSDAKLKNVVPILGGFHTVMSFLGAIGFIMAGSGLKQLLTTIYADHSVDKMLSGHAYARAVRGHILCHVALDKSVWNSMKITEDESTDMLSALNAADRSLVLTIENSESFISVAQKFEEQLQKLETNGRTAMLWVQYFRMVTLRKQFIEAERRGNWHLHLDTMQKMLPFFHLGHGVSS